MLNEMNLPSEISKAAKMNLLMQIQAQTRAIGMAENKSASPPQMDDISYFNRLLADIATMNQVRANDPTSFTSAHNLLLEEANLVWARLRANGFGNSSEALQEKSQPTGMLTPKRPRAPPHEAGDTPKLGGPQSQQPPKYTSPSSRKFFQWSSLQGGKSAVESPNWREDAKKTAANSVDDASSPTKSTKASTQKAFIVRNSAHKTLSKFVKKPDALDGLDSSNENAPHIFKLEKKVFIPEHPGYNFIGRILGPRGISIRQLEAATQCGILIRGKGSIKEPEQEERLIGKHGYDHLQEPLHVHITAMGTNMAQCQEHLNEAVAIIESLLKPTYDEYKKAQLIHLALINGTYREPGRSPDYAKDDDKTGAAKSPKKHE